MKACELKLIGKSLQISYDSSGNKYDLPIFVINRPERFEVKKEEASDYKGKKIKIKLQYLNNLKEFEVNLDDRVSAALRLALDMIKRVEEFEENLYCLKLVYQGKVFKDDVKIGAYLQTDALVQVFKTLKK